MTYFEFFKAHPLVKKLSLVQLIVYFGAWFSNVAIYTLLVQLGSSELAISVVTAMHFLPAVVIAPLSGAIIDRFKTKPLMLSLIVIELSMTLLFLIIDTKAEIWLLVIFIFVRMSAAAIFFSTEMSLLAKLLKGNALQKANEIHSIIWSLTYAIGMAVSGIVVNFVGVKIAFIIDALFFITAFLLFFNISFEVKSSKNSEKIRSLIKNGFLYLKNNKIILHLIFLHSSVGLTTFDTLITLLAKNQYKYFIAVPLSIGLLNAIRAVSLMIAPLFLSKYINKSNLHYLLFFQGLCIIIWALLQDNFYTSLLGSFLVGISTTTLWSFTYALIQEKTQEEYLGRVISYNDMIFMLMCTIITLFIGVMASIITLKLITILLGLGFILFGYYYTKILKFI